MGCRTYDGFFNGDEPQLQLAKHCDACFQGKNQVHLACDFVFSVFFSQHVIVELCIETAGRNELCCSAWMGLFRVYRKDTCLSFVWEFADDTDPTTLLYCRDSIVVFQTN